MPAPAVAMHRSLPDVFGGYDIETAKLRGAPHLSGHQGPTQSLSCGAGERDSAVDTQDQRSRLPSPWRATRAVRRMVLLWTRRPSTTIP